MGIFSLSQEEKEAIENEEEQTVFTSDEEVTVRIRGFLTDEAGDVVRYPKSGSGNPFILPELEIVDVPNAENYRTLTHYLGLPSENLDAKQLKNVRLGMQRFVKAFKVDPDPDDIDDWIGAEAEVILKVTSDDYGDKNQIKRFVGV